MCHDPRGGAVALICIMTNKEPKYYIELEQTKY